MRVTVRELKKGTVRYRIKPQGFIESLFVWFLIRYAMWKTDIKRDIEVGKSIVVDFDTEKQSERFAKVLHRLRFLLSLHILNIVEQEEGLYCFRERYGKDIIEGVVFVSKATRYNGLVSFFDILKHRFMENVDEVYVNNGFELVCRYKDDFIFVGWTFEKVTLRPVFMVVRVGKGKSQIFDWIKEVLNK